MRARRHAEPLIRIVGALCPALDPRSRPHQARQATLRITQHCSLGGVVSPVLSNIYLDRLDTFVTTTLVPEYTRGKHKAENPAYRRLTDAAGRAHKRLADGLPVPSGKIEKVA